MIVQNLFESSFLVYFIYNKHMIDFKEPAL